MNPAAQNIESIIQDATVVAGLVAPLAGPIGTEVAAGAQIALILEQIIANAIAAHQAALGEPMDLSKLHQIIPAA